MSRGPGPYSVMIERGLGAAHSWVEDFLAHAEAEGAISGRSVTIYEHDYAVLARRVADGQVVGAIVFVPSANRGDITLNFAYVAPDHRRRGLFARMQSTLVLHAQCVGAAGIVVNTLPRAGGINSALRRAGFEIAAVRQRLSLGEAG